MLKLSFRYRFEAAHRFLGSSSPNCQTPHGHTWHAEVRLNFHNPKLDTQQMSVEFSEIKTQWKNLISLTFDHSYMHNYRDPLTENLKSHLPEARLIPCPGDPTTELLSVLLFSKMAKMIEVSPYSDVLSVDSMTIEETPTNKILCSREFYESEIQNYQNFSGWWLSPNTDDRSLKFL